MFRFRLIPKYTCAGPTGWKKLSIRKMHNLWVCNLEEKSQKKSMACCMFEEWYWKWHWKVYWKAPFIDKEQFGLILEILLLAMKIFNPWKWLPSNVAEFLFLDDFLRNRVLKHLLAITFAMRWKNWSLVVPSCWILYKFLHPYLLSSLLPPMTDFF